MKFSEIQKKEVIDATKGSFLGYVQDATIDVANGKVESLHVNIGERSLFFDSKQKNVKKISLKDITVIGKDIVLVGKKGGKE
jgi:YlmC/YmxH family sporulation protein